MRGNSSRTPQPLRERRGPAPIHKLPNELLAEIFILGLANYQDLHQRSMEYLWAIGATCLFWREVALSTPRLWTSIIFTDHQGAIIETIPCCHTHMRVCLLRSKDASITVHLRFDWGSDSLKRVTDILIPHLPRCQSIHLHFANEYDAHKFLPLPGRLPSLTEFTCTIEDDYYFGDDTPLPLKLFSDPNNGARLQELRLDGELPVFFDEVDAEDLLHIHSTDGPNHSWNNAMALISRAHSLRSLTFRIRGPRPGVPFPKFTLPHLTHLATKALDFLLTTRTPNL